MAAATSSVLDLTFNEDVHITKCMRSRAQGLQQRNEKPQDGEKLLKPNEHVYRIDFSKQRLSFLRWKIHLKKPGKLIITGTSQHWTPDLTNLMKRQLLEPSGIYWKKPGEKEICCLEADTQEFGERIAELAKIRKVMYFILSFVDGLEPSNIKCSISFKV